MIFTVEDMRDTILGKTKWSKCPLCEGTGLENWDELGENVRAGYSSDPDRYTDTCQNCEGLGFVVLYQ